jgi:hypothetical protein
LANYSDIYVLDLETTTDKELANKSRKELLFDNECTFTSATMYAPIAKDCNIISEFYGKNNAENAILNLPYGKFYTWNGARFDIHFIYHLLRKAGYNKQEETRKNESKKKQLKKYQFNYLLSGTKFISLSFHNDNGIVEIRDACLLFTCSLDSFIKNTCPEFPKLINTYDYAKYRFYAKDFSEDDIEYCRSDIKGFAIGMYRISEDFFQEFEIDILDSFTAGSFAMKYAKQHIEKYDTLFPNVTFDRNFVAGGRTYVNPIHEGKIMNNISKIDAKSFYPSIMVNTKLPYGAVKKMPFNSNQLNEYLLKNPDKYVFAKLIHGVAKYNDKFSPIVVLDNKGNRDYPSIVGASDNVYLDDNILRDKKFIHDGVFMCNIFESQIGIFDYMRKTFELKNMYKKIGKKALELAVKIILNSTFGKFIQQSLVKEYDFFDGIIKETGIKKDIIAWYLYPPMGAAITANCRYLLTEYMNLLGDNFIYCDTDSLVFIGVCPKEIPLGTELGQWEEEATITGITLLGKKCDVSGEFIAFQRKTYGMELNGETIITFCGISTKSVESKYPNGVSIFQLQQDMLKGIEFDVLQGNKTQNGVVLIERSRLKKYVERY